MLIKKKTHTQGDRYPSSSPLMPSLLENQLMCFQLSNKCCCFLYDDTWNLNYYIIATAKGTCKVIKREEKDFLWPFLEQCNMILSTFKADPSSLKTGSVPSPWMRNIKTHIDGQFTWQNARTKWALQQAVTHLDINTTVNNPDNMLQKISHDEACG